jgi:CRP/FNR family transcriptional regulator
LEIVRAGDSFGAESLYNNAPSPWTAEAIQAGNAIYIPPNELSRILTEYPDFSLVLLELISKKLRSFTGLVHSLAFRDVTARLAEVLLVQVERNPQTSSPQRIERILSQQDLAALVGTAREVIYRTLKKFEQEGILQVTPTHIIILDIDQLQTIANQETH